MSYDLNDAMRNTLALVLAGGRGSRLRALTDQLAKPAVPFGGKFRIIDFPLSNCLNSGVRKISVLTQYRAHELIRHIERGWNFLRAELGEFIELWPAQQQTDAGSWYLGTADAVFQNLELIESHRPRYVLILAGDHVYRQDYSRLLAWHLQRGADATVSCVDVPRALGSGFGIVDADAQGRIVGFLEKPADPPCVPGKPEVCYASMGIYVFNAELLREQLRRDAADDASSHDFGHDLVPYLVPRARVYAHPFAESCVMSPGAIEPYWRDVGTLDAFWEANLDLTHVTPSLDLYDGRWPIYTYHEQRPAAKFVFDDDERRGAAMDSLVSAGCIVSGGTVRRCLLFNDVRVNSYSLVEDSILLPGVDVGRRARLRKVIVAGGCKIPEGLVIGEDRALDEERFHVSEGGVTLVTSTMLEAVVRSR
ncbi:glucose-1-phosphate adenylyltransferase [Paraliomyxa miuraensis]|uniref:glucose-1-phosphate adenylyltransferase n=1 Tax=Paraliomyxa miuraensis TaxID=376150 RepID=UPI0022544FB7|nr:glucose-1-phosphate adenylyltransferase [Paraliomyxa miuraensis]MCX4241092.1 glucose-1-phosphate adenylyltransferase [Paraliomyxa miuraensis]